MSQIPSLTQIPSTPQCSPLHLAATLPQIQSLTQCPPPDLWLVIIPLLRAYPQDGMEHRRPPCAPPLRLLKDLHRQSLTLSLLRNARTIDPYTLMLRHLGLHPLPRLSSHALLRPPRLNLWVSIRNPCPSLHLRLLKYLSSQALHLCNQTVLASQPTPLALLKCSPPQALQPRNQISLPPQPTLLAFLKYHIIEDPMALQAHPLLKSLWIYLSLQVCPPSQALLPLNQIPLQHQPTPLPPMHLAKESSRTSWMTHRPLSNRGPNVRERSRCVRLLQKSNRPHARRLRGRSYRRTGCAVKKIKSSLGKESPLRPKALARIVDYFVFHFPNPISIYPSLLVARFLCLLQVS